MICRKCGKDFDPAPSMTELCSECSQSASRDERDMAYDQSVSLLPGFKESSDEYSPWEDEQRIGFFRGLFLTLRQSLFQPTNFFRRIPLHGGYKLPFLYALIIYTMSIVAAYFASAIADSRSMPMSVPQGMLFAGPGIGSLIYVLLVVTLEIFIKPVILFICLLVLGVRNSSLEATFRISCYSSGPGLLNILPFFGSVLAGIWEFVILVIGLREGFKISTGRAVLAILAPLLATIILILAVAMLLVGRLFSLALFN